VEGVKAGMHIEMPGITNWYNDQLIVEAVKSGELDEKVLDNLVAEILTIVFKARANQKEGVAMQAGEHHQLARQVAAEAATLLKNDGDVLPLTDDKYKTVAIIGEFATNPRYQGNGSSEVKPTQLDAVLDILNEEFGKDYKIKYAQGYNLKDDNDYSMIEEATKVAGKADIALVFAGLPLHYESEGIDRKHIDMPEAHNKLISEVAGVNENTVVVLTNGSAVAMPWLEEVKGVLEGWLGGQAGAGGVVDVLFGKVNPSGKLAETFPYHLEDTPAYLNFPGEEGDVLYGERMFVGYRHYDAREIKPMFPFGYGLTYTDFEYSALTVSASSITDTEGLTVSLKVKNTGDVKGKEIVQLYVSDKESTLQRPVKELKEFAKVELEPGQEKEISFKLDGRDFSYFDSRRNMWIAESGEFVIKAGSSSADIHLEEIITLKSTQKVPVAFDEYTFLETFWAREDTRNMIIEMLPNTIRALNPGDVPLDEVVIDHFIAAQPIIKLPYFSGGEVTHEDIVKLLERCKEMTYTP
jgi:beta-glucosidase